MANLTHAQFLAKLEEISPLLRRAFEEAITDIRSVAQMRALEAAIERGDIEGAVQAVRLGAEFFAPLDRQIDEAFRAGAVWQLSAIPKRRPGGGAGLVVRFDGRHPRAEAASREQAARLVVEVTRDTQRLIRETVTASLTENRPPRETARLLIGRISGNQRTGGLVGLTSTQATYVRNMRAALADPETVGEYLTDRWTLRDRSGKYTAAVRRALAEGRGLLPTEIDEIGRRYADRLLQERGKTIGRTETLRALNAGRSEGVSQMIEQGSIPADAVTMVWQSTPSARTRDSHAMMQGQTVRFGEPFVSPITGARMMFPGDTSMGAPASELINCRCTARQVVDYVRVARARGTL